MRPNATARARPRSKLKIGAMRLRLRVFSLLCAIFLSTSVATVASTVDAQRTLAIAQSRPLLEQACIQVALPLGALPARTTAGDASVAALRSFVHSKRSVNVRAWCLRNARDLDRMQAPSTYATDLAAIELAMLTSHDVNEQLVGARAAWGDVNLRTGRLLLRLARPDRSVGVRVAALRNLYWPMNVDIATDHDGPVYARTIDRALHDHDDRIAVAGLLAYSMLYQKSADATSARLRPQSRSRALTPASSRRSSVRMVIDGTDSRLFALGLRRPGRGDSRTVGGAHRAADADAGRPAASRDVRPERPDAARPAKRSRPDGRVSRVQAVYLSVTKPEASPPLAGII